MADNLDFSGLSDEELDRVIESGGTWTPPSREPAPAKVSPQAQEEPHRYVDSNGNAVYGDSLLEEGVKGAVRAVKAIGGSIVGLGSGAVRLAGTPVRALTGWDGLHRVADSIDSGYENWGAEALASDLPDDDWGRVLGGFGEKMAGIAGSLGSMAAGGGLANLGALGKLGRASKAAHVGGTLLQGSLPWVFGNDAAVRTYDTAKENGSGTARALGLAGVNGLIHFAGFKLFENQSLNKMLGMPNTLEAMMPAWANAAKEAGANTFSGLANGVRNGMFKYILAERAKGALKAGGIMGLQNFLSSVPTQMAEGAGVGDVDWGRAAMEGAEGIGEGALMEGLMGGAAMLKTPKAAREFIAKTYFRDPNTGLLNTPEGRMFLMKQNPEAQARVVDIVEHGGKVSKAELDAACLPPDMTEEEVRKFAKDWRKDLASEWDRAAEPEALGEGEELEGNEPVIPREQQMRNRAKVNEMRDHDQRVAEADAAERARAEEQAADDAAVATEEAKWAGANAKADAERAEEAAGAEQLAREEAYPQPVAEQPAAPEQAPAQEPTEPPVAERSNRLRRNLKPNFRHQGENQQQPQQEIPNETGNVPVEAQPEPSVQDAGRGGQRTPPQAAEGLVEGEAPRGEVPAAGEVAEARPDAGSSTQPAVRPMPAATQEQKPVGQKPVSKSDKGGQKLTGGEKEEATPPNAEVTPPATQMEPPEAEPPKTAPASAPSAEGATTPPQSAEPVQGAETAAGGAAGGTAVEPAPTQGNKLRTGKGKAGKKPTEQAKPATQVETPTTTQEAPATQEATPEAATTPAPTADEQAQTASQFRDKNGNMKKTLRGAVERISSAIGNRTGKGAITPEEADAIVNGIAESPEVKHNRSARFFAPLVTDAEWQNSLGVDAESAKNLRDAVVRAKTDSEMAHFFVQVDKAVKKAKDGKLSPKDAVPLNGKISEGLEKAEREGRAEAAKRLREALEVIKPVVDAVSLEDVDKFNRSAKGKKLHTQLDGSDRRRGSRGKTVSLDTKDGTVDVGVDGRSLEDVADEISDSSHDRRGLKPGESYGKGFTVEKRDETVETGPKQGDSGKGGRRGGNRVLRIEEIDGDDVYVSLLDSTGRDRGVTGKMTREQWETLAKAGKSLNDADPSNPQVGDNIMMSRGNAESPAARDAKFAADADYQRWLKSRKANDAEPLRQRYEMEQAKALGDAFKNAVRGVDVEYVGDRDYDPAIDGGGDRGRDVRHSRVTDNAELERLNGGETVKVYRAMQMIDGKLYPPMAAKVDGKLVEPTEIGTWYRADERPDLIKDGKFKLDKANGAAIEARYNPYFHTSRSPLNDQFSSANKRPNLVTVEVEIPKSELTSGYRAEGAKDAVGEMDWHSGPVSSKLPRDKARKVILSRWAKVVRVVPDAEVADVVARTLNGERLSVPENTVTPSLRRELEQRGVRISNKGEPVRYLHDRDTGTVLGIFDRDTGKLKLFRGASWKTLNHEFGHATMRYAEQEAARGNRALLDRINEAVDGAMNTPLADEVRRRYPDADEATLRDEIWAALRERPSEAMQKYVKTLQGRKWYNRAWDAIKTAWRGILSRMGFNRADLSGIDKMTPDEFNEFLDKAMIGGKTLGRIETASPQSSVRMARGPVTPGPDVRIMDDEVKWLDRQGERFVDSTHNLRKVQSEVGYRDRSDPKSVGVEEVMDPKTGFVDWRKSSDIQKAIVKSNGFVQKNEHILQVRRDRATREMAKMKGLSEDAKRELVDDYLTALHAEERNRTIADRRGDTYNDDYAEGSGRSAKWARDFIANDPNVQKYKAELDRIADIVHEAVVEDLRLRHENGLLSDDEYNFYSKKWKHYVPLRTDVTEGSPEGGAFNTSTATFNRSEYRTAKGRGADNIASSPFAFAFVQAHDGIGKSAKNIIGNVTANFIDMTEAKGLNSTKVEVVAKDGSKSTKTEYRIAEVVPADVVKRGGTKFAATFADGTTAEIGSDMRLASHQDNLVLFKRPEPVIGKDGKPTGETAARLYVAKFTEGKNGRGIAVAKAITGKNMVEVPFWVQPFSKATHFLSRMNTSASPSFLTSNIFNDRNEAWRAMSARFGVLDGAKMAAKVWKYRYADGKDLKNWLENGELRPGSDVADFINGGAAIKGGNIAQGFSGETSSLKDNLARQERKARSWWERFKRIGRFENVREIASSVGDVVQSANELEELGTRYGVYHAVLDELVAKGVPREVAKAEAVTFCRGATTDFNVRGTLAPVIGSFYMFYNANVQGTRRNIQSLTDKHGVQTFATLAGVASAMTVLRYWLGNDEEREKGGERNAKNALEYQKQSAMGIPIPSGRELSILKMRGVDALIPYAATKFTEAALYDDVSAMEALADSLKAAGGEALGVLGGNGVGNKSQISQTLAPSLADPFIQWATGTDWQGERRVKQVIDKTVPQSYNARHGTSDVFKWIAETVNDISRGNQYRKGLVDMAPEDVQLIVETLAGGLGRDIAGAINTFSNVKEVAKGGSSERLFGRMPIVKSLVREYPDSTSRYFDALDEYNADKAEFKKTTELGRRAEMKKEHPYLTAQKGRVDAFIEQVQELTHRERGEVKVGQKWVPSKVELSEERKEAFRKRRLRLQAEVLRILGK